MRIFTLFILAISLTGCGTVQQTRINSAAQDAGTEIGQKCSIFLSLPPKEAAAWLRIDEPMGSCSSSYSKPFPRDKMMEVSACGTEILDSAIKPVSYSSKQFNKFMEARNTEHKKYANGEISWDEMNRLGKERLSNYFSSSTGRSYFEYANCHNAVFNSKVMPVYPAQLKPVLIEFMTNLSAFSRDADKKKMEPEDYQVGYQKLWSEFASKEQQSVSQSNAQNAAAWQQWSRQTQQYLVDQEKARQTTQMNQMKSTNCHFVGNTMNCTEF